MRSSLLLVSLLVCWLCVCRGQMDLPSMYGAEEESYEVYAVVDADDFDIQQFGFGGAGFGGYGGAAKGLGALRPPTTAPQQPPIPRPLHTCPDSLPSCSLCAPPVCGCTKRRWCSVMVASTVEGVWVGVAVAMASEVVGVGR